MDLKRGFEWFVCKFCRLESFPRRCQLVEHKKSKHYEDYMKEIQRRRTGEEEDASGGDENVVDLTDGDEEETGPVASGSISGGQTIAVDDADEEVEVITILSQESTEAEVPVAMASTDSTEQNEGLALNSEVSVESRTSLDGEVEAPPETKMKREDEGSLDENRHEELSHQSCEPSTDERQIVYVDYVDDVDETESTPVIENRSNSENTQLSVPPKESTSTPQHSQQSEPAVGTSPKGSGLRLITERLRKYVQRKDRKIASVKSSPPLITKKRKYSKYMPWYDRQRIAQARRKIASNTLKQVCKKCGVILPSPTAWQEHLKEHEGKEPLSCPQCRFKFYTEERLDRHILKKHSLNATKQKISVEPYACKQCEQSFRRRELLRSHLLKVHKATDFSDYHWESDCSDDRDTHDDDNNSERGHVEVVRGKFICQFCPDTFKSERAWFEHKEEMHNQETRSREGVMEVEQEQAASKVSEDNKDKENTNPRDYRDNRSLHSERTTEGSMNATSVGDSLSCPVCHKQFKLRIKVRAHMKKYHSKTEFPIASEVQTRSLLVEEEASAKIRLPSPRKFAKGNQKATNEDEPFKCWKCPMAFARRDDQSHHLKHEHDLSESEVAELVSTGVDSALHQSNNSHRSRVNSDTDTKKTEKRSNNSASGTPVKPRQESLDKFVTVSCAYCKKDVLKAGLEAHMRKNHPQHEIAGPSTGSVPQNTGSSGSQLPVEVDETENRQCRRHSSSSSDSSSSTSASDQTSTETLPTDKAKCFQFVLKNPKDLTRKSRYGGEDPVQCSGCDKIFVYRGAYDRHVLEKHNGNPTLDSSSGTTRSSSRKDKHVSGPRKTGPKSGQKKQLHCPFCIGIFHEMTALEKHVIHTHSIIKAKAKELIKKSMDSGEIYTGQQSSSASNVVKQRNSSKKPVKKVAATGSSSLKRPSQLNMSSSTAKRMKGSRNSLPLNMGQLEINEIADEFGRVAAQLHTNYPPGSGTVSELSSNHYQASGDTRVSFISLPPNFLPAMGPRAANCHLLIENPRIIPLITQEVGMGTGYAIKKEAKDDYNMKCSECGIRYDTEEKLREHEKIHLPGQYECPYCSKRYVKEKWCLKHVQSTHGGNCS